MRVIKKIAWTRATDDARKMVSSRLFIAVLILSVIGSIISGITEFWAIDSQIGSSIISAFWCFCMEAGYSGLAWVSAALLFLYLVDRGTYSYLFIFMFTLSLCIGLFFLSRSLSSEGKDKIIVSYSNEPQKEGIDSTEYKAGQKAIELMYQSKMDSINASHAKLYAEAKLEANKVKMRKGVGIPYGLSNVDNLISKYGKSLDTWQVNRTNALRLGEKNIQSNLRGFKELNEQNRVIALDNARSEYNSSLSTNEVNLLALVQGNNGIYQSQKQKFNEKQDQYKAYGEFGIYLFLAINLITPFVYFLGNYWAGQRLEFREVHKGSFLYLVGVVWMGSKAKLYNRFADKVEHRYGNVIEVKKYHVETAEKQETTGTETANEFVSTEETTDAPLAGVHNINRNKTTLQNPVQQSVSSYASLVNKIVSESNGVVTDDKIRSMAVRIKGYNLEQLKSNVRNYHKRDSIEGKIKFRLAQYRLNEVGHKVVVTSETSLKIIDNSL